MFNFKDGIGSPFAQEAAPIHARDLAVSFASKASGPVVRTPAPGAEYALDM